MFQNNLAGVQSSRVPDVVTGNIDIQREAIVKGVT